MADPVRMSQEAVKRVSRHVRLESVFLVAPLLKGKARGLLLQWATILVPPVCLPVLV